MKNIYLLTTVLIAVCLSLIPPINFIIRNPPNDYWLWMILIAGFFGIVTIFIETNFIVKVIAIGSFINCFFSAIPYVSFTSYVSIVLCCYLYIMASKIKNWDLVFKSFQAVVILDLIIFVMQATYHDPLLNFGYKEVAHFGTLGQHMQMGSFGVIITALLIPFSYWNIAICFIYALFCHSSWTFICGVAGLTIITLQHNKYLSMLIVTLGLILFIVWGCCERKELSISGRLPVWKRSIELTNQRPLTGWGVGTYKDLFFPLSRFHTKGWREAHNFIVELSFEVGYVVTGCLLFALGCLIYKLYALEAWSLLAGLIMILMDALVHFPDRMMQTVPMIIIFFAYTRFMLLRFK